MPPGLSVRAARAALLALLSACAKPPPAPDAPASPWRLDPVPLPVPRLEPGVTALGTQLVVAGGFDTDLQNGLEITRRVDVLDTFNDTWSQFPDAPVAWTHLQLAAVNSTLYLLGGLEGQTFTARGEAFALDTLVEPVAWRAITPLPAGLERGSAAVVVAPPRIYLLGGASSTDALASVIYYDVAVNGWCPGAACSPGQEIPDLPAPRSHPMAMRRFDGALVVAGGLATLDSSSQSGDVWVLAPEATAWQPVAPMPQPVGGAAAGVLQGQFVCAGGEAGTSALSLVQSYNPICDTWEGMLPPMPEPRAGTQGAAIGQQLYVPGGAARLAFEPTDTLYIYAPLDTSLRASLGGP